MSYFLAEKAGFQPPYGGLDNGMVSFFPEYNIKTYLLHSDNNLNNLGNIKLRIIKFICLYNFNNRFRSLRYRNARIEKNWHFLSKYSRYICKSKDG